jgi:hypothetical protein
MELDMNALFKRLKTLSEDELHMLAEAADRELSLRAERHDRRGYCRSTYLVDRVRGERLAERQRMAA